MKKTNLLQLKETIKKAINELKNQRVKTESMMCVIPAGSIKCRKDEDCGQGSYCYSIPNNPRCRYCRAQ
tara:strand:- start:135 stop:341 length:207 start_codon:yes stop_codon:yes gene_type:complete